MGVFFLRGLVHSCEAAFYSREFARFAGTSSFQAAFSIRKQAMAREAEGFGILVFADEVIRDVLLNISCGAFFRFGMGSLFRHQHRNDFVAVAAVDAEIRVQREDHAVPVEFAQAHQAGIGQ